MKRYDNGYVALLSVLIIGAAATAIALTLLVTGSNSQRSALVSQQSIQARQLASSCAEEALQRIRDNVIYVGSGSLTLSAGSCTFNVTNNGAAATITTSGTVNNNIIDRVVVYVTINASNITITSWQETA